LLVIAGKSYTMLLTVSQRAPFVETLKIISFRVFVPGKAIFLPRKIPFPLWTT
jgi:hypothetical protein